MILRKFLESFFICILINTICGIIIYFSPPVQEVIKRDYSYTIETQAVCESIYAVNESNMYSTTYTYKPDNSENKYYVTYLEINREPDIDILYVNENDNTKVSKIPSTKWECIGYLFSTNLYKLICMVVQCVIS